MDDSTRFDCVMCAILAAIAVLALAAVALAAGPLPEVDPEAAGEALVGALSAGEWVVVAGSGGLILIWLLRLILLQHLDGKALAITSVILIGLAAIGTAIVSSPDKWLEAIAAGVGAAVSAATAWDLLKQTKVGKAMDKAVEKRKGAGQVVA